MIAINMKMPESCLRCPLENDHDECSVYNGTFSKGDPKYCTYEYSEHRPDWCPLHQVDTVLSERILSGAEINLLGEQVSDTYAKQDVIARLIKYISDPLNSTHYVQYGVKEESNPYGLELDRRYRATMYVVKMKEDKNGSEDGENI